MDELPEFVEWVRFYQMKKEHPIRIRKYVESGQDFVNRKDRSHN